VWRKIGAGLPGLEPKVGIPTPGPAREKQFQAQMIGRFALALAASAAACFGAATTAQAGTAARAWVSGHGVDQGGCGAPAAPCRSLQYAHDNAVAAGGEIDILDPAGYGAITITKAISIVNDGVGTAGVQSTGPQAILINAGAGDHVYLKGLNIDGLRGAGASGIFLLSAGALTIDNCVTRNFAQSGITLSPGSGAVTVEITNVVSSDNGANGIAAQTTGTPTITLVIDHAVTSNNGHDGILFGVQSGGEINVTVTNSLATNNAADGVAEHSVGARVYVDSDQLSFNGQNGLNMAGVDSVGHLSRSLIDNNTGYGIDLGLSTFSSAGNSEVEGNGARASGIVATDNPL
jgi:hypothetical protein